MYTQGDLVLNKSSDFLNFLFSPGAVPNRTYRPWVFKIGRKNRELNSPDVREKLTLDFNPIFC